MDRQLKVIQVEKIRVGDIITGGDGLFEVCDVGEFYLVIDDYKDELSRQLALKEDFKGKIYKIK